LSRLRQTIARRLSQAKREVPHYYVTVAIDMTAAMELRKQLNSLEGVKISVNDMVVKACALALKQFPTLNASFGEDSLIMHDQINVSIAIATDNGLLAPAITDVDKKSLGVLAAETRELAERTRSGKATPDELGRGTFTVSNLGMFGVESFVAIINPPQAAIVAVGAATETPVVKDGQVAIAPIMKATISADHRVSDGVVGAQYLQAVKALLETPMRLLV
jgi:pyruvate dehydrogenase E2 component (dihydrolipoamide acetyltransferase)